MFGRNVFVKRDDLIDLFGINGNKARKFFQLAQLSPFPLHVASIGGCQSNAMLSIATLVSRHPSSKFTYFTKEVPPHVKGATTTSSNYLKAVGLGMKVRHSRLQYCISWHTFIKCIEVPSTQYEHLGVSSEERARICPDLVTREKVLFNSISSCLRQL